MAADLNLAQSGLTIRRATSAQDIDDIRDLMRDFSEFAMAHVAKATDGNPAADNPSVFAELEAELASLPGKFAPPSGCLMLALLDGAPVGCVAFYGHTATTMEIKRMFVRPNAWGHGVGKKLLIALLAEARVAGYTRYLLWTHFSLIHAQALYRSIGFIDVPFSADFPGAVPGSDICMELLITDEKN